jgi:hypothetical protein
MCVTTGVSSRTGASESAKKVEGRQEHVFWWHSRLVVAVDEWRRSGFRSTRER